MLVGKIGLYKSFRLSPIASFRENEILRFYFSFYGDQIGAMCDSGHLSGCVGHSLRITRFGPDCLGNILEPF